MSDETRKPARRWPWFVLFALFLGTLVGGGAWLLGPKVWIDGRGLRVPGNVARIRNVVWDLPKPVGPEFSSDQQQYEPSLSPDGNEFYFVRNKPGQNADIYVSYRRNNQWTPPIALEAVNSAYDDLGPRVTADGKFLLFYSDRPGGFGGYDIWASERTEGGWGTPFNLGPGVNSEYNEFSPDPTPDGKHLIFATNRKAAQGEQKQAWRATIRESGTGDYDLWIADLLETKTNAVAQATAPAEAETRPSNIASASTIEHSPRLVCQLAREIPGINTPFMEGASCMSPAGDFLYFASNRPGGFGKFDIYRSRVSVGPDGSWKFDHPENAGAQINSAENETDPAVALNGFRLYFSTDRDNRDGVYRVLVSNSREVFPIHDARALPRPTLSFWLMLASLLVLVPLLLMLRGWDDRKLGMLQKCLLLSLLVHVGICFALSFLKVTAQAYHLVRQEMGVEIPVALSAPREAEVGYAIRHRSSSDLPIPGAPPEPLPQSQTPVESTALAGPIDVSTPVAQAQSQSQSLAFEIPRAASPLPSATPDSVAAAAPAAQMFQPSVQTTVAAVQHPEVAPHIGIAEPVLARSDSAAENLTIASPKAISSDAPPIKGDLRTSSIAAPKHTLAPAPLMSANAPAAAPASADPVAAAAPPVNGVASNTNAARVKGQNESAPSAQEAPISVAAQTAAAPSDHPNETKIDVPQALPSGASAASVPTLAAEPRRAIDVANSDSVPALPDSLSISRLPTIEGIPRSHATRARAEEQTAIAPDVPNPTTRPIADAVTAQQLLAAPHLETTSAPPTAGGAADSLVSRAPEISRPAPITTADAPSTSVAAATPSIADAPTIGLPNASGVEKLAAPSRSPDNPVASATDTLVSSQKLHAFEGGGAPSNIPIDSGNTPVAAAAKIAGIGGADPLQSRPHPTEIASASVAPDVASILPPPSEIGPTLPKVPQSPFRMRAAEQHKPVIEQLGGTKESETAVDRGLAYLAAVQENDGHWTMVTNSQRALRNARHPHDSATTALATLAFLAQDHRPDKPGPYQQVVSQSLDFLLSQQQDNGDLRGAWAGGGADQGNMYDHGIATLALAEAALITRDPRLTEAAFKGARFIVSAQNRDTGGWRYIPNEYGDSSVFGWQVMALHSAEQLGFEIPAATRRGMVRYIALASSGAQRMLAGYQPRESPTAPMTAEIVFCRMLLGQQLNDDEAEEVSNFLGRQPPQSGNADIYYWYYGSLCMMQMQSDAWKQWNTRTRDMLVRTQRKIGESAGYWDNMKWSDRGGRVFTTAMATLTLEVYYRYLPLQKMAEEVLPAGAAQPADAR